jgi:hypothetical protein
LSTSPSTYQSLTCRRKCPYAACIDVCEHYDKIIPPGLRSSNPREYRRLYYRLNREKINASRNEYNSVNRERERPKWRAWKRRQRGSGVPA